MKTSNKIRNTAVTLLLGLSFMVSMTAGSSASIDRTDANEFANAGYWIDPVVVTYDANKEFANAGYWIDPVVVTYDAKKEFANAGYWIDPVVITYDDNKEFANAGYWIDPVVVTYNTSSYLALNN